jgi:hypothetical protein
MVKFFIPFAYFLRTRAKKPIQLFSWFCVFVFPSFLLFHLTWNRATGLGTEFLIYTFELIMLFTIYEIGYIENDIVTIRHEKNPTIRLPKVQIYWGNNHLIIIILLRYSIFLILFFLAARFLPGFFRFQWRFLIALLALQLIFVIYNRTRAWWVIPLFFMLVFLRFASYGMIYQPINDLPWYTLVASLVFPVPNVLEWIKKKKPDLVLMAKFMGNIDTFRVQYYTLLTIFSVGLLLYTPSKYSKAFLFIAGYFLIYRTIGLIALKAKPSLSENFTEGKR